MPIRPDIPKRKRAATSGGAKVSNRGGGRVRASGFKDAINRSSSKFGASGDGEYYTKSESVNRNRKNLGPYTKENWDNDRQERRNLPDYKGPAKGKKRTSSKFPKGR
jgi:hypothetical protein